MENKAELYEKLKEDIRKSPGRECELCFEFLYEELIKICKNSSSSYHTYGDYEDLAHEVFLNVYRKIIDSIIKENKWEYKHVLGYMKKTANNILNARFNENKNHKEEEIPEERYLEDEESYIDMNIEELEAEKRKTDMKIEVYNRCIDAVTESKLKPYTIIGFFFNRFIYPFVIVRIKEYLKTSTKYDVYFIDPKSLDETDKYVREQIKENAVQFESEIKKILKATICINSNEDEVATEAKKLLLTNHVEKATCPKFTSSVLRTQKIILGFQEMKTLLEKIHKYKKQSYQKIEENIAKEGIGEKQFICFFGNKSGTDMVSEWTRRGNKVLQEAKKEIIKSIISKGSEGYEELSYIWWHVLLSYWK